MYEITHSQLVIDITGGKCYSQTVTLFDNEFTILLGSCEV